MLDIPFDGKPSELAERYFIVAGDEELRAGIKNIVAHIIAQGNDRWDVLFPLSVIKSFSSESKIIGLYQDGKPGEKEVVTQVYQRGQFDSEDSLYCVNRRFFNFLR